MTNQNVKPKLAAILSTDVEWNSRLIGTNEMGISRIL